MQQHPKFERAIHLLYPSFFCKLLSSPTTQNRILIELGPQIHIVVITVAIQNCMPDYWLEVSIRKVLATGHLDTGFSWFPCA